VRLHLLGDTPLMAFSAQSLDPSNRAAPGPSRGALVLRHRSEAGATLRTTFVTVFEPLGTTASPLRQVGRVAAPAEVVVLFVETDQGAEHLVVNLTPGTVREVTLADGSLLRTDGVAVRVTPRNLMLAGGTFAEVGRRRVAQSPSSGAIVAVTRGGTAAGRGSFVTDTPVADPDLLVGRTLLIRHGDGTTRGWTLTRVENTPDGAAARLHVHEEPGFTIAGDTGAARYYQFPRDSAAGPHRFTISRIARAPPSGPAPAAD
jgi:hypothetical protein